jgi:hypothetical protein
MADLGKALGRWGPHPRRGAVGPHQGRKARLDRGVAALERVIGGVADLGRVVDVIGLVCLRDQPRKARKLGTRFGFGECLDRDPIRHARLRRTCRKV